MKNLKKKDRTLNELRQTKDSVYKHKPSPAEQRLVDETHIKASEIAGEIFTHLVSYHLEESLYIKREDNWITSTNLGVELFDAMEHIIEHELLDRKPRKKPKPFAEMDKVLHNGKWYVKYQDII